MHRLAIAIGTLIAVLTTGMPQADAAARAPRPYCLDADRMFLKSCTFYTFQQCLETANGVGGICYPNPEIQWRLRESGGQPAPQRRQRSH